MIEDKIKKLARGRQEKSWLIPLIVLFIISLLTLDVQAQNKELIVNALNLRFAKSITFYMNMDMKKDSYISRRNPKKPNEAEFKNASCIYRTENPDDITSLAAMFYFSEARKSTAIYADSREHLQDDRVWNTYFGVYFTFSDGTEAKYLFEPDFGGPVNGYLIYPAQSFDRYPIEVHRSLPWQLVYWASRLGEPIVTIKGNPDLTVAQCRDAVTMTIYQRHYDEQRDK